jgi:gas vesicle protein
MATAPSRTADEISHGVRALVDRVLEADVTDQVARTSRDVASALADATNQAADRAGDAWKESRPVRRDAAKAFQRASRDTAKWWNETWRKELRPGARDLWKRRTVALGAAGAAIPASRELVDDAAVRLGLKRREERHWGVFFLGLIIGAAAGAIIALLTTPKPGTEMREDLAAKARDAGEWVPIFQRDEETNGRPVSTLTAETEHEMLVADAGATDVASAAATDVTAMAPGTEADSLAETSPVSSSDEADERA